MIIPVKNLKKNIGIEGGLSRIAAIALSIPAVE